MTKIYFFGAVAAIAFMTSCDQQRPETLDTVKSPAETANNEGITPFFETEKNGIIITEAPKSYAFIDARLSLMEPDLSKSLNPGKNAFVFKVENFDLSVQTPGADHRECANSKQGQHIHWILDNSPYTAHYEPRIEKELEPGKHLLLAFLSRSYHESIKNNKAYILKQVNVGDANNKPDFDLKAQHLFYSRPKGDYEGADTKKILLDFYLVNTSLADKGNKVRLTVNGTEFLLTRWIPYQIEGLPMGENIVRIQLVDNSGLPVTGPFNDSGDRKIILKPGSAEHVGH